jgi:hypothetical protein
MSSQGIEVNKAKIEFVEKLLSTVNVKGVRSYLAYVNFYRRFIKDFSKIVKPLSNLLVKDNVITAPSTSCQVYKQAYQYKHDCMPKEH